MIRKASIDLNHGFTIQKNTLSGGAFPTNYVWTDPDGYAWYQNVVANGGTITNANQAVFDTAFQSLKSTTTYDGTAIWDTIGQGYWFVGQESLTTGLMVPFKSDYYSGNATNNNFTSYTKTGGLAGNGTSTYINTNIVNNNYTAWPVDNRFGYVYCTNAAQTGFQGPFGMNVNNTRRFELSGSYSTQYNFRAFNNSSTNPGSGGIPSTSGSGGFGIVSSASANVATKNVYMASIQGRSVNASPVATGPATNLVLGARFVTGGLSYGSQNMQFAAFGESIDGGIFDFTGFQGLDSIVSTLISSLT
jgi:hypothetical protein